MTESSDRHQRHLHHKNIRGTSNRCGDDVSLGVEGTQDKPYRASIQQTNWLSDARSLPPKTEIVPLLRIKRYFTSVENMPQDAASKFHSDIFFQLKTNYFPHSIQALSQLLRFELPNLSNEEKSFIAGAVAGAVSRTATAPMDRIKVALQAGNAHGGFSQDSIGAVAKKIYTSGGWPSFFRGNGANVIKVTPESAFKFWVFSFVSNHFGRNDDRSSLTITEKIIAGSIAGATAQFAIYPLEISKTYLSLSRPGDYNGILHSIKSIARRDGIPGLYRGLTPSLLGIVPYAGIDLALFFSLKEAYMSRAHETPSVAHILLFGAISSSCGQIVSYPFQVIRTKLQVQGMKSHPIVFRGMQDCFLHIFKKYGVYGLYRGILPNFMKSVPSISISYTVFESIKNLL